ncbi:MAG: hypothetical protein Ta2A_04820 [Treponemataceae bacterium]|nr:MAG: hypothetical protein Ta2A_04820 [Treponemataceae bacterium]
MSQSRKNITQTASVPPDLAHKSPSIKVPSNKPPAIESPAIKAVKQILREDAAAIPSGRHGPSDENFAKLLAEMRYSNCTRVVKGNFAAKINLKWILSVAAALVIGFLIPVVHTARTSGPLISFDFSSDESNLLPKADIVSSDLFDYSRPPYIEHYQYPQDLFKPPPASGSAATEEYPKEKNEFKKTVDGQY